MCLILSCEQAGKKRFSPVSADELALVAEGRKRMCPVHLWIIIVIIRSTPYIQSTSYSVLHLSRISSPRSRIPLNFATCLNR